MMETQGQEDAQSIGDLVDAVNTVLELEAAEIEPSPTFGAAVHSDFILGMAKLDKVGFVTLLAGSRTGGGYSPEYAKVASGEALDMKPAAC
jgi:purine-binding chemotaxis protein CheW